MERAAKLLVILTICMPVFASEVERKRRLEEKEKVDGPQNFYGSLGGTGGIIPTLFGPAIALGPSVFCSFPGIGCVHDSPAHRPWVGTSAHRMHPDGEETGPTHNTQFVSVALLVVWSLQWSLNFC